MRVLFVLLVVLLAGWSTLSAQLRFEALGGNPRLIQKSADDSAKDRGEEHLFIPTNAQRIICPDQIDASALRIENAAQKKLEAFRLSFRGKCIEIQAPDIASKEELFLNVFFEDGTLKQIKRQLVAVQAVTLPFTDEFSYADVERVYPDENRWLDRDAYVNDHLAYHPPTLGVATLDGADENGQPYGKSGSSDTLTSTFIDLSSYGPGDDVYFSFTYQPGGLSIAPFREHKLVLEFKNADQEWIEVFSGEAEYFFPDQTPPEFSYEEIALGDTRFLHDNFQFRFRNFGPGTGLISVWHLDYIRVEANFEPSPKFRLLINDIALGHPPYSLLRGATAMPLKQFLADVEGHLRDTLRVDVYSHTNETEEVESNRWSVVNLTNGDTLAPRRILLDPGIDIALQQPEPGQYVETMAPLPQQQRTDLSDNMSSRLAGQEEAVIEVTYDLNEAPEAPREGVEDNNKASTIQYLSDFFAYDDGSPEGQLPLSGDFGRVALEFELLEPQAVKGVLLSFVVVTEADSGEVFQYELRAGSPEGTLLAQEGNAMVDYPSGDVRLPQFAYYEFPEVQEGIELQPGKYYLIVRSKRGSTINIGYDRQFDMTQSRFYEFRDRKWQLAGEDPFNVPGVVMARLVTSDFERTSHLEHSSTLFNIFPNPVDRSLYIEGLKQSTPYRIYDIQGRLLLQGQLRAGGLDVSDLNRGVHILMLKQDKDWVEKKFIIQRR